MAGFTKEQDQAVERFVRTAIEKSGLDDAGRDDLAEEVYEFANQYVIDGENDHWVESEDLPIDVCLTSIYYALSDVKTSERFLAPVLADDFDPATISPVLAGTEPRICRSCILYKALIYFGLYDAAAKELNMRTLTYRIQCIEDRAR